MVYTFNRNTFLMLDNEDILELLNDITRLNLYSVSIAWRESSDYVLKAKGSCGDVIVTWK